MPDKISNTVLSKYYNLILFISFSTFIYIHKDCCNENTLWKEIKKGLGGLPAISIFVSRKLFEAGIAELLFWFDVATTVVEARLAEVETMFSTISALFCCVLLLVEVVLVLEASKASEVTTTAAAGTAEATAIEATVLEAAAVVNTVTAGAAASGAAVAVVAHAAAATATEAAEAGWGCFLEDEGLLDPPHEEAVEELLDSVEAAAAEAEAAVEHNISF